MRNRSLEREVLRSLMREAADEAVDYVGEIPPAAVPPSVPKIDSCDRARHKYGAIHVVRWKNRSRPCKRVVPSNLKLAILSRARTRIPLRVVKWLIDKEKKKEKDKSAWIHRIPIDYIHSHVDLTIELFQQRELLSDDEIETIFLNYLRSRHANELGPICDKGFFLFQVARADPGSKDWVETHFGLQSQGLDLNELYQIGGVSVSGKSRRCYGRTPDETPDSFSLLCYITLPNSFERELKPLPPPPPPPEEIRRKFAKDALDVEMKYVERDTNLARQEKMKCLLRLLTGYLLDGEQISDEYRKIGTVPSARSFLKEARKAWDASGGDQKKFWFKLNGLYSDIFGYLGKIAKESLIERAQSRFPSKWYERSKHFRIMCRLHKRAQKSNDIMYCFGAFIKTNVSDRDGKVRCP